MFQFLERDLFLMTKAQDGRCNTIRYLGGGQIGEYFSENEYAYFLFYVVSRRFNNLLPQQNPYNYSYEQIANYKLIKSLRKGEFGYRKIAQIFFERGGKTKNEKEWTNGLVHSVWKRYSEQKERLAFREKEYSLMWGRVGKEFTK